MRQGAGSVHAPGQQKREPARVPSSARVSVLDDEALLVRLREATRDLDRATAHANGDELGKVSLPLGPARAGVAAGHFALGNCHCPAAPFTWENYEATDYPAIPDHRRASRGGGSVV